MEPAGRDPGRAFGAPRSGTSDALFPEEVQSFPDNFSARLGYGSVDNAGVERRPRNNLGDSHESLDLGGWYASDAAG
jgi:hypothetical protein